MQREIKCWREEPIGSNPFLTQVGPDGGAILLDTSSGLGLFRYVFFSRRSSDASTCMAGVVVWLLEVWGRSAWWVLAWRTALTANHPPARVRAQRSKLRREGWETADRADYCVSCRPILRPVPRESWLPSGRDTRYGGVFGLVGTGVSPARLSADPSAVPSLQQLATVGRLAPGRSFLSWLAASGHVLLYPVWGHLGEEGLVVVGPEKLALDDPPDGLVLLPVESASAGWGCDRAPTVD